MADGQLIGHAQKILADGIVTRAESMMLKEWLRADQATYNPYVARSLNAIAILDDAFRPRPDKLTPFPVRSFGDGTMGVFYSALDERTCQRELGTHLAPVIAQSRDAGFTRPRRYALVQYEYHGITAELRGKETNHPELVSKTEVGYPFCQSLARKVATNGIAGFLTRSARDPRAPCLPVFVRNALSSPEIRYSVTAHAGPRGVEFLRT